MRKWVLALAVLVATSGTASADEAMPRSTAWRLGGALMVVAGCAAVMAGNYLVADAELWGIGNGLGEHYDPTPGWVPTYTAVGGALIGASQPIIITGIMLLQHGDSLRERERQRVTFSLAPTRNGGLATVTARF